MKVLRCFLMGVLLAVGNSVAVDVNWLTGIVKAIRKEYRLKGQFCVAAAIPHRQDSNTLAGDVLHDVPFYEGMEEEAKGGHVFVGSRVILAAPAGPVHAEYSVLENLPKLNKYKGDFLLIYSYLSPCSKCTDRKDRYNILRHIDKNIQNWSDRAFVFTKVYDKRKDDSTVPREVLRSSLKELAFSMGGQDELWRTDGWIVGLQCIFRCVNISDLECHSCSVHNNISEFCIDNNAKPHQAGSSGRRRQRSRSKSRDSRIRNRGGGSSRRRGIHKSKNESNISESRRRSNINRSESRRNRSRSSSESSESRRRSSSESSESRRRSSSESSESRRRSSSESRRNRSRSSSESSESRRRSSSESRRRSSSESSESRRSSSESRRKRRRSSSESRRRSISRSG